MNIVLSNSDKADRFAYVFQHMKLFTEQINIMFEETRMYIQAMDNAKVSVFEIDISSTWFDKYERTGDSNVCLGINASTLYKILNTRDKSQELSIVYDAEESDKLAMCFSSKNKAVFDKNFVIPLIDIDEQLMQIPVSESQAEIAINSTNFANIISQLRLFGDTIDISCNEEQILLSSNSIDSGKMTVEISMDDLDEFSINDGATLNLSFSLAQLHNICMYHKIGKDVQIKWINDFPMQINYSIDDDLLKLRFYLAPKMSDD